MSIDANRAVGERIDLGNLVIGEVVYFHIDEGILDENGKPDPHKVKAIARLGSDYWCHTSDLFRKPRPTN